MGLVELKNKQIHRYSFFFTYFPDLKTPFLGQIIISKIHGLHFAPGVTIEKKNIERERDNK